MSPVFHVQIAPLAPPTQVHPWGLVALAWHEATAEGADLRVGAWDLAAGRMLRSRVVRHESEGAGSRVVRIARGGNALFVLTGGVLEGECRLFRLDAELELQKELALGDAWLPSLVADDHVVAAGTFERDGYHVRLVDASTFAVMTTRTLGDAALAPWPSPARSSHALRLEDGRLYVALPERDPRVVALRLPALATEASIVFPIPSEHRWAYSSVALDAVAEPLGFETADDGHVLLARDLSSYRKTKSAALGAWAPGEPSEMGERVVARAYGRTVISGVVADEWVLAVGR